MAISESQVIPNRIRITNAESRISNLILIDKRIDPYAANHDQVHKQLYYKTYNIHGHRQKTVNSHRR